MPLVPAKCPECGGNINIESEQRLGVCEYCKQPFVVQEAINHFNTTYNITNNNEIKTDVVNIYQKEEKDFIIRAGILEKYIGEYDEVVIPDSVKGINKNAFNNSAIRKVTFGRGITDSSSWGEGLFDSCKQLEEIILAPEMKVIGDKAFEGLWSIKEIIIPEGCTHIGNEAFSGCGKLETVSIAKSVKYIGKDAFSCSNLKLICIKNMNTEYGGRLYNPFVVSPNCIVTGGRYSEFIDRLTSQEEQARQKWKAQIAKDIQGTFAKYKNNKQCPACWQRLSFFGSCNFIGCENRSKKVFDGNGNLLDGRFGKYYSKDGGYLLILRKGDSYYERDKFGDRLICKVVE